MTDKQLQAFITEYLDTRSENHRKELDYFRNMPSLRRAVEVAMTGKDERGKMYAHQCLVGGHVLSKAAPLVVGAVKQIGKCESFDELYSLIADVTRPVYGFGPLATYDIALRIGAYRNTLPDKVYLHCGTRKGAKIVSPGVHGDVLPMNALPPMIGQYLTADEAENFLCYLANRMNGGRPRVRC